MLCLIFMADCSGLPGVRGTVRDAKSDKASWMPEYFDKTYGSNKFELAEVADLAVEGSLYEAVKGP